MQPLECTEQPAADWREARDRVVIGNLTLVRIIAIRVHENLPVHVDLDDLIHAGVLGLIDAAQKFDDSRNTSFQSYAKHRIKGAILDSLRQLDWASRDLRKRQKQADEAARGLSVRLGRAPTESEVAMELGVPVERWRRMSMELRNTGPAAFSRPPNSDHERDLAEECPAAPDLRPDCMCEQAQLRTTLKRAIGTRRAIRLHFPLLKRFCQLPTGVAAPGSPPGGNSHVTPLGERRLQVR